MPVDRELAMKSMEESDSEAYAMYTQLSTSNNAQTFGRLVRYVSNLDTLDRLESRGMVEIQNDYESGQVRIKQRYKNEGQWRPLRLRLKER